MPAAQCFDQCGSNPAEWVKHSGRFLAFVWQITVKCVPNKLGRKAGDPGNPSVDWALFVIRKSGIGEAATELGNTVMVCVGGLLGWLNGQQHLLEAFLKLQGRAPGDPVTNIFGFSRQAHLPRFLYHETAGGKSFYRKFADALRFTF